MTRPSRALSLLLAACAPLAWSACADTASPPGPPPASEALDPPDATNVEHDAAPLPSGPTDAVARDSASEAGDTGDAGPAVGCGAPAPKTGLLAAQPVVVDGAPRSYSVNLPSSYDGRKSFPVVFVFHGVGQDSFVVRSAFQFEKDHEAAAIFVYPNATALWDILHYDDASNPDVAFFDELVADLERRYCLDKARMYATGVSRGGYFANHLACHRSAVLKAVASHAAGGPLDVSGTHFSGMGNVVCPGAPIPALVVVGDADTVALGDADNTRRHYREANGCGAATTATTPSPCVALSGCAKKVTYCKVPGLAHDLWSAGSKATWDFFGL